MRTDGVQLCTIVRSYLSAAVLTKGHPPENEGTGVKAVTNAPWPDIARPYIRNRERRPDERKKSRGPAWPERRKGEESGDV